MMRLMNLRRIWTPTSNSRALALPTHHCNIDCKEYHNKIEYRTSLTDEKCFLPKEWVRRTIHPTKTDTICSR